MTASHPIRLRHLLLTATLLSSPLLLAVPTPATAQVSIGISVELPPPMLPDYEQPPMPEYGYVWTPGYWSWAQPVGHYWVPGTWVLPPEPEVLWTPPYWGWLNGLYYLHAGYWGRHVGYYGGVDYGYGYNGDGYDGGRWEGRTFHYNRVDNNFGSVVVRDVYEHRAERDNRNHVSFADGPGGNRAPMNDQHRQAERERHEPMTQEQTSHVSAAVRMPDLAASHNGGRPAIAASTRPAQFQEQGVTRARPAAGGEPGNPAAPNAAGQNRPAERGGPPQVQHETPRGGEPNAPNPAARPPSPAEIGRPPERQATPPPQPHGAQPPVPHEPARPAEANPPTPATRLTPPAEAVRPPERVAPPQAPPREAAPPVQREQARPPERMAPPPVQHEQVRPPERPAPPQAAPPQAPQRPPERPAAPPPQQQREAPPQPQHENARPPQHEAPAENKKER